MDTENAIKLLDADRPYTKYIKSYATKKLRYINEDQLVIIHINNCILFKKLTEKLLSHNLLTVPDDKGKTILVIHNNTYLNKIEGFLTTNHFLKLTKNPTPSYQKQIPHTLQQWPHIINKHNIRHLVQRHLYHLY
jgi:hypothetical protein